jgi:hypothetical protein
MENPWKKIETAPRDGTQVLLASIDDTGGPEDPFIWGVRQGFYETATACRCWYDIDGGEIEPHFWMPLPVPPPRLD